MYGLTRATVTLISAALAGLLVWIATHIDEHSTGGYWGVYGLIAAAGLVMALSQLLGGWTKWGWPRVSISVFLWAFVPVAIVVLWIVIFQQPHGNWFRDHIRNWSGDIGIEEQVKRFLEYVGVLAFGLGLVFGFTFDTTGPIQRRARGDAVPAGPTAADRTPPPGRREPAPTEAPPAEPPPREGPPA
jgi:hypothetical protein